MSPAPQDPLTPYFASPGAERHGGPGAARSCRGAAETAGSLAIPPPEAGWGCGTPALCVLGVQSPGPSGLEVGQAGRSDLCSRYLSRSLPLVTFGVPLFGPAHLICPAVLVCTSYRYMCVLPVSSRSIEVSDATITRQSSEIAVSHATIVSKQSGYTLALFPGKYLASLKRNSHGSRAS